MKIILAAIALSLPITARAATLQYVVEFETFTSPSTARFSFTLDWDQVVDNTLFGDSAAGFSVTEQNFSLESPIRYSWAEEFKSLTVGGVFDGVRVVRGNGAAEADFLLGISYSGVALDEKPLLQVVGLAGAGDTSVLVSGFSSSNLPQPSVWQVYNLSIPGCDPSNAKPPKCEITDAVPTVPLPASLPMLAAGIMGLGLWRRKQQGQI